MLFELRVYRKTPIICVRQMTIPITQTRNALSTNPLCEGRRPVGSKDLLGGSLGNTVRKRELEVLLEELLNVGTLDISSLLNLDDLEDLYVLVSSSPIASAS